MKNSTHTPNSTTTGLRCRPGDIALIAPTGSYARCAGTEVGKLVRVVRPTMAGEIAEDPGGVWLVESLGGMLRVDVVSQSGEWLRSFQRQYRHLGDRYLIPLRDAPGDDESLRWADKPKPKRAARKSRSVAAAEVASFEAARGAMQRMGSI